MKRMTGSRRGSAGHITLARAARMHRFVTLLAAGPQSREDLLRTLSMGLRTFYRELELLKKCGIKIRTEKKLYTLKTTTADAEGRLPFPDPQLSFAEMAELSRHPGEAAKRLAGLLAMVIGAEAAPPKKRKGKS